MAHLYANLELETAKIASQSPEMDEAEAKVLASVRSVAAMHRDTGNYIARLGSETVVTTRGVHDRLITADDPEALLIEWGGIVKKTGRVIPGLHIMKRGLDAVS